MDPTTGALYATGRGKGYYYDRWIVRKTEDEGETWKTVDELAELGGETESRAVAVVVDAQGRVFVAGIVDTYGWGVRRSTDGGLTWTTVDVFDGDYLSAQGLPMGEEPAAIAVDTAGNVYVTGQVSDYDGSHWVVRASRDHGETWLLLDDYAPVDSQGFMLHSRALDIATDPAGRVFVVGKANGWVVRMSPDGMAPFTTIDAWQGTYTGLEARAVSAASGSVFVVGAAWPGQYFYEPWIVRKGVEQSDGQWTWTQADLFEDHEGLVDGAAPEAVRVASDGTVYVAGTFYDPEGARWMVRSAAPGAAFQTTAEFQLPANSTELEALALLPDGGLVAAGWGMTTNLESTWVVARRAGGAWSTLDVFAASAGYDCAAHAAAGAGNRIFVAGSCAEAPGQVEHWIVRSSDDRGDTWAVADDLRPGVLGESSDSVGESVAIDPSGVLYVAGQLRYGVRRRLVRKSADGGRTWNTVGDFSVAGDESSHYLGSSLLAVDANGVLYLGGVEEGGATDHLWVVRRTADGGQTWELGEDLFDGSAANLRSITVDPVGTVYAGGNRSGPQGGAVGLIRTSADGGRTWRPVGESSEGPGWIAAQPGWITALAAPAPGVVFAAAARRASGDVITWSIARSTDGGTTWTEVDSFRYPGALSSWPEALIVDAWGRVFAAGKADGGIEETRWIVRSDLAGSWSTIDDFLYGGPSPDYAPRSAAHALALDGRGALFIAGEGSPVQEPATYFDGLGPSRWLTRRSEPTP